MIHYFNVSFPGPPEEWVRGNASNVPFWPGGMEWNPAMPANLLQPENLLEELNFHKDLKTIPPGFSEGMDFGAEDVNLNLASVLKPGKIKQETALVDQEKPTPSVIDLADLLREQGTVFDWMTDETQLKTSEILKESKPSGQDGDVLNEIPVVDISNAISLSEQKQLKSTEWAEIIDVSASISHFDRHVPNPAHTWPFELDNFQKHVRPFC